MSFVTFNAFVRAAEYALREAVGREGTAYLWRTKDDSGVYGVTFNPNDTLEGALCIAYVNGLIVDYEW